MDFSFLKSVRFWKLFVVVLAQFLGSQGIISTEVANLIGIWLGTSVAIRTVDKAFAS